MFPSWQLLARALGGLGTLVLLAWLLGERRRQVRWKPVASALLAQAVLAWLTLRTEPVRLLLLQLSSALSALREATLAGTSFAFGYVGGAPLPFSPLAGGSPFVFAFQALPMVIVVSALSMLLFHWRILPLAVGLASRVLGRLLGIGGALSVCTAAKLFLGQTEAPLLIRPFLARLSRSELFTVMTLGMATTSSSVMVVYASILGDAVPHPIRHILTASLISLPAALAISRLMVPAEGKVAVTAGGVVVPYHFDSSMEAISRGAGDGMRFFTGILAMLLTMLALVSLCDAVLANVEIAGTRLSVQIVLGRLMAPIAWLTGVPWAEAEVAGKLLGEKTALNEVIAFISLAKLPPGALGERSRVMMTYALCGFANFSSIGIQIGGLGNMAPERKPEILQLALRSLIAGTIASLMSATVVGALTG